MKNIIDISKKHLELVTKILKKNLPAHANVWAFGSRVKSTSKPYSDLDLAIDAHELLSSTILAKISDDFEESILPYKIDILDWQNIDDSFKKLIQKDRVLLIKGFDK